jgi:RNA polymerase sigma factor for flagellar operon FliA
MGYEQGRLIESLPWARRFARGCAARFPNHPQAEDLQSAGMVGYMEAAERYDGRRGSTFLGFCAVRIRGAIVDELRRWEWAPRSVQQSRRRITEVTLRLLGELGRNPADDELAEALGLTLAELDSTRNRCSARTTATFDEVGLTSQGEETLPLAERLADPAARLPDADLMAAEDRRNVRQCLHCLPKTQATVIVLHYLQEVPLREVAAILCVTPARVSQLHHQALDRLRQCCRQKQETG